MPTLLARCLRVLAIAGGLWLSSHHPAAAAPADPLDLAHRKLLFADEFDRLDVSARGPGTTWTAHTPWHGDFGDATFVDPQPGFPFTISDGVLHITMRRNGEGRWQSGLLSSTGPDGQGFSTPYGYFEMRAKFPSGPGVWPAFWLDSQPPPGSTDPSIEVDIVEQYGKFPGAFNSTVTVWHKGQPKLDRSVQRINRVPAGIMSSGFHLWGADITPKDITIYFDRRPIWHTPTPPEHHHGFDILVDLGLGGGWPIEHAPNPAVMEVDYVRVYAPR
jgi:beta-glucanase (GH16 family)